MSWLARSIADTLSLNDEDDDDIDRTVPKDSLQNQELNTDQSSPRGVKEDLSEISKTLSRQFWGVASFLAPPPQPETYKPLVQSSESKGDDDVHNEGSDRNSDVYESDGVEISGIRSDLSEIGGRFKSGFSKLSENIKVSEITKMATDFLQKAVEEMNEEAARSVVGVSEDVVAFAKNLALHPETWLDFPLPEDDMEEGFDMSDAQQEHALAVERLAPSLAALRMELCPEYISESCFWKIYFVLLHPKLDKEVAVILSTPQVMEARALLTTELQNHSKVKRVDNLSTTTVDQRDSSSVQHEVSLSVPSDAPNNTTQNVAVVPKSDTSTEAPDYDMKKHPNTSIDIQVVEKSATSTTAADLQTDKHPITTSEIQIVDKSVIEVEHNDRNKDQNVQSGPSNAWDNREDDDDDDNDDWLKEETSEMGGGASETTIPIDNDEDVSFSDLEDDDIDAPSTLKKVNGTLDKDSPEWVQL